MQKFFLFAFELSEFGYRFDYTRFTESQVGTESWAVSNQEYLYPGSLQRNFVSSFPCRRAEGSFNEDNNWRCIKQKPNLESIFPSILEITATVKCDTGLRAHINAQNMRSRSGICHSR